MRDLGAAILTVVLFGAAEAVAITPATRDEVLCTGSTLIEAEVTQAESLDCRVSGGDRYCPTANYIGLTVRVTEAFFPQGRRLGSGSEVRLLVRTRNDLPMGSIAMNDSGNGAIGLPATGRAVTDAEARARFLGKRFLFALTPPYPKVPRYPIGALAYEMSEEAWARRTWASSHCRRGAVG